MTITLPEWFEVDPEKKNEEWANKVITYLRQYMQFLVNPERARRNMQVLLGTYDVEFTKDMFQFPEKSGVDFVPLSVMEKLRNVLASEIEDAGIQVQLKAEDPTAYDQKQRDRELLANRKQIEALVSTLNAQIGRPPYSLKDEEENGEELFGGDTQRFDDMGFDSDSDEDLDHFFNTHYRLRTEIMAESPVNFFLKFNQVEENFTLWVNDIMAKKAVCAKVFVNQINGAIVTRYVAPETVRTFSGNRRDFQDSPAREYIQNVFVHEFMQMVGDEFNPHDQQHMLDLMTAVNLANGRQFTGVHTDGYLYCGYGAGVQGANLVSFADLMQFKVQIGYIEFKTTDKYVYKATKKNKYGNPRIIKKSVSYQGSGDSDYNRMERPDEVTRKAFYLVLTGTTQKLFQYGKLCYQGKGKASQPGMEDEYTNFSICIYKEVGKTATEVSKSYIRIIERAFKQFEKVLIEAKPPGTAYLYESLVKVAQKMFPENNTKVGIQEVINMFEKSANQIYTLPEIEGAPVGGGTSVNIALPNGLAASATQFLEVINWAFNEINSQLGISPLRNAYAPQERDTAKLQLAAQQSSEKATGYLPRMMMKMINHCVKRTLIYTQEIIKYRSVNEVAYEFLRRAIGDRSVADIKALNNIPLHRFGIFVISFNVAREQEEMKQILLIALQQKEITTEQYLLIKSIQDPQKAAMVLAYEKRRNERKMEQALQQRAQESQALQAQLQQIEMQKVQVEGQMKLQNTQLQGEIDIFIERLKQEGELSKQAMKIDAKPEEISAKKNAQIEQDVVQANLDAQKPIGAAQ